jgi:hypothetical protein
MSDIFWAAFGGGAAAGIFTLLAVAFAGWLQCYINRPLVRCELNTGFHIDVPVKERVEYVYFTARNSHSKSVKLEEFGLIYKDKQRAAMLSERLPYQLAEGDIFSQSMQMQELFNFLRKENREPRDARWIYFRASSGKWFRNKVNKGIIRQLQKKFSEI